MIEWQGKNLRVRVLYSEAGVATQILITIGGDYLLVDVGDGTLRDLRLHGINFRRLKGILLTHGHFDHVGGLYALLGYLRVIDREEPLHIFFPQGCLEACRILVAFKECYKDNPFAIVVREVEDRGEYQIEDVKVRVRSVIHYASTETRGLLHKDPAVGYRLLYQGQAIAISGDTGACPALSELVKGADLALIDATLTKEDATEELLAKLHLSEEKAKEVGQLAKEYLLFHRKFFKIRRGFYLH